MALSKMSEIGTYEVNISNCNSTEDEEKWEASLNLTHGLNTVLLISTFLMLASVVAHGNRRKLWTLSTQRGKLYVACTTSIVCALPRLTLDQVYYHLHNIPGGLEKCELFVDWTNSSYAASVLTTYIFLWMRQRVIYSDPSVHRLTPRWIRPLSWFALGYIVVVDTVFMCFYVIPPSYTSNGKYCVGMETEKMPSEFKNWAVMKKYFVGGPLVVLQILLLFLFIYPLIRNRMALSASSQDDQSRLVSKMVRRSAISAIIAVSSDSMALLILALTPWGSPVLITDVVYNASIFTNMCCVVCTFKHPLDIILVFCKRRNTV